MKVVVLSDLNWERHLKNISDEQVMAFTLSDLKLGKYNRIQRYYNIIIHEKADLVLFAGDITGDGSCGHGYHNAMKILLLLLEYKRIPNRYISGNHDEIGFYDNLKKFSGSLEYSDEISNKICTIEKVSILGLSFDTTKSKSKLKKILKENKSGADIIIAHSEIRRRIRLLDIPSKVIVTGHYDRKLFGVRDRIFIALDNDSEEASYCTIRYLSRNDIRVNYCIRIHDGRTLRLSDTCSNLQSYNSNPILTIDHKPTLDITDLEHHPDEALINKSGEMWLYMKYLRGQSYRAVMESMFRIKHNLPSTPFHIPKSKLKGIQLTPGYKLSASAIRDYLG